MTPAFGFSVGDFISAISKSGRTHHTNVKHMLRKATDLITKITKALKETGGASSEYQDAVIELNGLKTTLRQLEALQPTDDNIGHVNAIRGMALACQLPLRDFQTKLEAYEASLGPWEQSSPIRRAGRKTKWAVIFTAEVDKLRALVAAKQISINLLLSMQTS